MYQKEYMVINAKSIDTLRAQAYTGEYQNQAKLANSPATHDYRMWFTQSLLYRSTLFQNTDSLEKLYKLSMNELFSEEFKNLVIYDLKRDISGLYTSIENVRNLGPIGTYDFFSSMVGSISAKYIPTFAPMNYDFTTDSSLHFNVSSEEKRELILNRKGPVGGGDPVYATKYIYTPLTIGELEAGPQPGVEYSSKRTEITEEYVPLSMNIIQKLVKYAETYADNADDSYVEPIFPGASEIYVREYTATKFRYLPLSSKEIAKGPVAGTTYFTKPVNTTANYVVAPYSDAYTCYIREYDNVVYTYSPLSCIDAAMGPKKDTQYFTRISKLVENYVEAQLTTAPTADDELYYKEFDEIAYNRVPLTPEEVAAGPQPGTVYSHEEAIPPSTEYVKADKYEDGKEFYEYDPVANAYNISTNFETVDDYVQVDTAKTAYNPDKEYFLKQGDQFVKARTNPETTQSRYAHLNSDEITAGPQPGEKYVFPEILHIGEVQDEERAAGPDPDIDYYELTPEGTPKFVGKLVTFEPDKFYTWFELGTDYQDITDMLNTFGSFALDNTKIMKEVVVTVFDNSIVDFHVDTKYALNTEPYNVDKPYYVKENDVMRPATEADLVDKAVHTVVDKVAVTKPDAGTTYYKLVDGNYVACEAADFNQLPVYEAVPAMTIANANREPDTDYYKLVDGQYVLCTDDDFVKDPIYGYVDVDKGAVATPDPDTEYYVLDVDQYRLAEDADFSTTPKDNYTQVDKGAVTNPDPDGEYYVFETDQYRPTIEGDFDTSAKDVYDLVDKDTVTEPDQDGEYFILEDDQYRPAEESDFDTVTNDVYSKVETATVTEPDPDTEYFILDADQYRSAEESDFTLTPKDVYEKVDTVAVTTPDPDTEYYVLETDQYRLAEDADFDTTTDKAWNVGTEYYTKSTTNEKEWTGGTEYYTKSTTSEKVRFKAIDYYTKSSTTEKVWKTSTEYFTKSTTTEKTWSPDKDYYTKTETGHNVVFAKDKEYFTINGTESGWKDDLDYYTQSTVKDFKPDTEYYLYDGYDLSFFDRMEYYTFELGITRFKADVEYFETTLVDNGTQIVDKDNLTAFEPDVTYYKKVIDYVNSTRTENYVRLETDKYDPLETYYTKTVTNVETDEYEEFFGTVAFNPDVTYYTRVADLTNSTLSDRYTPYTGEYDPNQTYYKLEITETDSVYDVVSDAERAAGPVPGTTYYVKRVEVSESFEEVPQNDIAIHIAAGQTAAVTDSQPIEYYTKVGNVYEVFSGAFDALTTYYTKEVTVKELDVYDPVENIVAFEPNVTYYYEVSINDDGYVEKTNLAQFVNNKVYYVKTVDPNNSAMGENYVPYHGTTFNDYPEFYTKSVRVEEFDEIVGYVGLKEFNPHVIYFHRALNVDKTVLAPEEINVIKRKHTIAKLNAYHDVYLRDALTTVKEIMSKHSLHVIISSVNMEADKYDRTIANEMYIKFLNVFTYLAVVIGHSKNLDDTCKGYKFINDMINVGLKHAKSIADMFSTANYVSKIVLEHLLPKEIKEAVFQHYDICSPVCDNISCSPNLTQSYVTENMVENMIKLRNLLDNVDISTETDDNALMGLFIMAYNIFVQLFFYSAFNSRNKVQIVKAVSTLFKTFTPSFDQVITAEELKSFIELGDDK